MEKNESIPFMQFESNASAPILRYDVPSPSSYEGRNYIELSFEDGDIVFNSNATNVDLKKIQDDFLKANKEAIVEYLSKSRKKDLEQDIYLIFKPAELELFEEATSVSYPAEYTFAGLLDGTTGTDIDFVDSIEDPSYNDNIIITSVIDGHNKVLTLLERVVFKHDFKSPERVGVREFWCRVVTESSINISFTTIHDETLIPVKIRDGNITYTNESNETITISAFLFDNWHHIRIEWFENNTFDLWLDEIREVERQQFRSVPPAYNGVERIIFSTVGTVHLDAIGSSSDPSYKIGDNIGKEEVKLAYEAREEFLEAVRPIIKKSFEMLDKIQDGAPNVFQKKFQLFRYLISATINDPENPLMPIFHKTMGGNLKLRFFNFPVVEVVEGDIIRKVINPIPRLMFIETYKLTTFPGDYGAGTTIKTFSLLPKEETEISIKTWKKTTESIKEASSILDSYTEEKADEFEKSTQNENSKSSKVEENFEYHLEAEVQANWGCGSAKVSGGVKGGTNSAREESAKNIMNATEKHTQNASSKREVNIDTSYERTMDMETEVLIMRRIENINASRTLNFTFRQMNQQFHSLLHLTDVRIAFYNGLPGSMREYALYELDDLQAEYLTDEGSANLKDTILDEYKYVSDYEGNLVPLVEENIIDIDGTEYNLGLRIIPPRLERDDQTKEIILLQGMQEYEMRKEDINNNQKRDVRYLEGVIIGRKVLTMKTDGIIVEALLGQANALDSFAVEARKEKIREEKYENNLKKANYKKIIAGVSIIDALIANNQLDKAITAYREIFGVQEGIKYLGDLFNQRLELKR